MENLSGQSERSHATPYRALRIVNRHAAAGVGVSPDLKVYTISDPKALIENGRWPPPRLDARQQPPGGAGLADGCQWWPSRPPDGRELAAAT